jgi:hypothetical protein
MPVRPLELDERLRNQKLAGFRSRDPDQVVAWFGGIQAQDFQAAKWAIGLRARAVTDAAVERAFNEGAILRTHVLRPTWHFVTPADIRWLIALTGPRVIARLAARHRQLEIDARTASRSRRFLTRALAHGFLTRQELRDVLQRAGIGVTPERLSHLLALAELEGLVCSGPLREGKFTYALMDRRAPTGPPIDREQALARLAGRYFRSHGPATVADFGWWSGLSLRDARRAVEIAGPAVSRDALFRDTYRSARAGSRRGEAGPAAWLLPNFDEYLVAYKDRRAIFGDHHVHPRDALAQTLIIDGRAAGTWRTRRHKESVSIALAPWRRLTPNDRERITRAAQRYAEFLGRALEVARIE